MKKNKLKIFSALMICFAFVGILLFSSNNKIYASEIEYDSISKTNNILDSANLYQGTTGVDGAPIIEPNNLGRVVTKDFISVIPNSTYSLTCYISNMQLFELNYYDINKNCLALNTINENEYQFTIPENCYYIILLFRMKDNGYISVNDVVSSVMFNVGNVYLDYEPYIPLVNNNDYQSGYNQAIEKYNKYNNYGAFAYIYEVSTSMYDDFLSFNDLITNNYLSNSMLDLYKLSLLQNESYSSVSITINFTNLSINNFDFIFKTYCNYEITIYDENGLSCKFNIDDTKNTLNYNDIFEKNSNFGNEIFDMIIKSSSPDSFNCMYSNTSYVKGYNEGYDKALSVGKDIGYDSGYNVGYDDGYETGYDDGMNDESNNLSIYNKAYSYGYAVGYDEGIIQSDNLNAMPKNFINALFSTPINIFKNFLNFDFFGINLFSVLTSLLTIFVVLFLFKRFKK